jgi:hypothetical protein
MDKSHSLAIRNPEEVIKVEQLNITCDKAIDLLETLLASVKKSDIKDLDTEKKFKIYKDTVGALEASQRMIRLEKNMTTSNVGIIVQAIKEAKKRKKEGITDAV